MTTTPGNLEQGQERQAASPANGAMRAGRFTRILVPVDFSRANAGAIDLAVARAVPGEATIWLLHVVEPDPALAGMDTVILAKPEAVVIAEAVERLERLAVPARNAGCAIDVLVRQGRRDEVICRIADELHADLIVLGQHEHVWWKRWLTSTTTERILRKAPCAVLALPGVGSTYDDIRDGDNSQSMTPRAGYGTTGEHGPAVRGRALENHF